MQRDSLPEWSGCPRRGGRSFAAGIGGGKMDGHGEDRLRGKMVAAQPSARQDFSRWERAVRRDVWRRQRRDVWRRHWRRGGFWAAAAAARRDFLRRGGFGAAALAARRDCLSRRGIG